MKHPVLILSAILALSGCEIFQPQNGTQPVPTSAAPPQRPSTGMLGSHAVQAAALDQTTAAERAAALAAPAAAGERALGKVVVALGPPADQGLWLKTSLVTKVVQGRIQVPGGKSLAVELRPGTGGALLSLAAFRALGISLTGLPEVLVFAP